ncbi:MAG: GNAT family N-acetyltransferase [Candidatus Micrarchaeota archaeon]
MPWNKKKIIKVPQKEYLLVGDTNLTEVIEDAKQMGATVREKWVELKDQQHVLDNETLQDTKLLISRLTPLTELKLRITHNLRLTPKIPKLKRKIKGIELKTATLEDLDQIMNLEKACFKGTGGNRANRPTWIKRINNTDVLKAVNSKGEIIGAWASATRRVHDINSLIQNVTTFKPQLFGHHYQFIDIMIDPKYRKKGVGQALVETGIRLAEQRKSTKIFIYAVSPGGRNLAISNGFVLDSRYHPKTTEKIPDKSVFMIPLSTGVEEQKIKDQHTNWIKKLEQLPKQTNELKPTLQDIIRGIRAKYPEIMRLSLQEQKNSITDLLVTELQHKYGETLWGHPVFSKKPYKDSFEYNKKAKERRIITSFSNSVFIALKDLKGKKPQ